MSTPVEKLQAEIQKILSEYGESINEHLDEATDRVSKAGLKALKANSGQFSGKYAKGWTITKEKGRLFTTATIHNSRPGLPHLLEKSHATGNGGRYKGRPHIEPVEKEIIDDYIKAVQDVAQ